MDTKKNQLLLILYAASITLISSNFFWTIRNAFFASGVDAIMIRSFIDTVFPPISAKNEFISHADGNIIFFGYFSADAAKASDMVMDNNGIPEAVGIGYQFYFLRYSLCPAVNFRPALQLYPAKRRDCPKSTTGCG